MFSAITLAGAAGELLAALVAHAGRKPFIDVVAMEQRANATKPTPNRGQICKHINTTSVPSLGWTHVNLDSEVIMKAYDEKAV
jgi:hypothetical protein